MKKIKYLFTFIFLFMIGLVNVSATDVDNVSDLGCILGGGTGCETISEAKLTADIVVESSFDVYPFSRDLVLDLNGHTLEIEDRKLIISYGTKVYNTSKVNEYSNTGSFTIKDSSEDKSGKLIATAISTVTGENDYLIADDSAKTYGLTIDGGTYDFALKGFYLNSSDNYENGHNFNLNFNVKRGTFNLGDGEYLINTPSSNLNDINININLREFNINGKGVTIAGSSSSEYELSSKLLGTIIPSTTKVYYNTGLQSFSQASRSAALYSIYSADASYGNISGTSYSLRANIINLTEVVGYTTPSTSTIDIKNHESTAVQVKSVTVSDNDKFEIVGSGTPTIAAGETNSDFQIKAKTGLSAGNYMAEIIITDSNDYEYSAYVSLKVKSINTVTFNTNGGSEINSENIVEGEKVSKPATDPTKSGYEFIGWYTDDTFTTEFDFENTSITKDTTIYAKFNEILTSANAIITAPISGQTSDVNPVSSDSSKYSVSFVTWYENVWPYTSYDEMVFEGGKEYTVRVQFIAKDGYQFSDGATFTINGLTTSCYGANTQRQIEFVAKSKVTFNSNGGSGTMEDVSGLTGSYTLPSNGFTAPKGKIFVGWSLTSDGVTTIKSLTMDEDKTVYALWKTPITEVNATITKPVIGEKPDITAVSMNATLYSAGGQAYLDEVTWKNVSTSTNISKDDLFVGGYTYAPYIAFRAQSGYCFTDDTVIKINGEVATSVDSTGNKLYIKVGKVVYTPSAKVTFNSNGGSGTMEDVTGLTGSYTLPANKFTAPAGKMFKGWSLTSDGEIITSLTMDENKTVYAIWKDIPVLTAPVLTITKGNNNSLVLSWDEVEAASKYLIYTSTNKKKWTKLGETTELTYTKTGLKYGSTYYYRVYAYNTEINSKKCSNTIGKKVTPNKVINVVKSSVSSNAIKISWDKVSSHGYVIYRSTNNKDYKKVATITKGSTLSYTNKKLSSNKKYYYKVYSFIKVGKKYIYGPASDVVSIITGPSTPKASISLLEYDSIKITSNTPSGATAYEIYRSESKTGTFVKVSDSQTYVDSMDDNTRYGKTYYYKVRVRNSSGSTSSYSSVVSMQFKPVTPTISVRSINTKKVEITILNANSYYDGFEFYRATSKSGKYTKIADYTPSVSTHVYDSEITGYFYDGLNKGFIHSSTKGKTYYYKVRAYKIVDGKKVYSSFTSIKSVKSK